MEGGTLNTIRMYGSVGALHVSGQDRVFPDLLSPYFIATRPVYQIKGQTGVFTSGLTAPEYTGRAGPR